MTKQPLQLGRSVAIPASPDKATLDRVPNPQPQAKYLARFTFPEFTSICPVTGQPDFGILVIDYVPDKWLVESKSLKLYLQSFRNHGAFHEDVTVSIARAAGRYAEAALAAHRRILQSARRHADRRVLADRRAARRRLAARSGRGALPRARLKRMHKGRLEAFSDGVIAVIITILVLELRAPHGADWSALTPLIPAFVSYVLSFIYLGIYWNNHHHLLQAASHVNGAVLWANLHLLFWLSLIPFVTGWMGENEFATLPVAVYGFDLLMAALAYYVLERTLIAAQGKDSRLKMAVGAEIKGWVSVGLYVLGILAALLWTQWVSLGLYGFVALMWLVPGPADRASLSGELTRALAIRSIAISSSISAGSSLIGIMFGPSEGALSGS